MLINAAGLVFIGERADAAVGATVGATVGSWQMPQGGIDPGESPRDAALRELAEEVGTDRALLLAESRRWYAYDLPAEQIPRFHGGRYRGQSQKWFALRFTGSDRDIDIHTEKPEFRRWRWAEPAEVVRLIVPFKRVVYEAVFEEFAPQLAR